MIEIVHGKRKRVSVLLTLSCFFGSIFEPVVSFVFVLLLLTSSLFANEKF